MGSIGSSNYFPASPIPSSAQARPNAERLAWPSAGLVIVVLSATLWVGAVSGVVWLVG